MNKSRERGFIGLLIVLIVAIIFGKYYFGWNALDLIKNPLFVETWNYTIKFSRIVWEKFLGGPIIIAWEYTKIFLEWIKGWIDAQ